MNPVTSKKSQLSLRIACPGSTSQTQPSETVNEALTLEVGCGLLL